MSRWTVAPTWVAVAPVVECEASSFSRYANGGFPEELAISVVRYAFCGPVKAIIVVAVLGAETERCGAEKFAGWDIRTGVDDEEEVGGFGRVLVQLGEEFNVYFARITLIL